jgi:DNA-binding NarL/FixJ family response regulator
MLTAQPEFEIVGEAEDGLQALDAIQDARPDVVLTDLRMPNLDGVGVIQHLVGQSDAPRVLVLTTYDDDADILRAIEAGACGYLLKDAPRDQLFSAIRAAFRGETWLAPHIAGRLVRQMATPQPVALSSREIDVLRLASRGSSNKEIAAALYLSEATVKSHLVRIYRKLDVTDRTAAVTVALRRGLINLDEMPPGIGARHGCGSRRG